MRTVDPRYGSQEHQKAFCARMAECHRRQPCTKTETDHEHGFACYPQEVVRAVCAEMPRA
jgi:hypothetical protein